MPIKTVCSIDEASPYGVYLCADYSLFRAHSLNRVVDSIDKTRRLLKGMKRDGFHPMCAIHVVMDGTAWLIVDGHRRFHVAQLLGLPVCFVVFEPGDQVTPQQYSREQRAWTNQDFAHSFSETHDDYREVMSFVAEHRIPETAAFSMFGGELASSSNKNEAIKEGRFTIRDRLLPQQVVALAARIDASAPESFGRTRGCLTALSKICVTPGIDLENLQVRIATHKKLLRPCRTADDYIDLFETIYNYTRRGDKFALKWAVQEAMSACQVAFKKVQE